MDISEDDYYLDSKKGGLTNTNTPSNTNEVTKESLTKTLFSQKNNSSLTSSSSDSSDDDEEMRKKTATIFKIDEPMESSTQITPTTDKINNNNSNNKKSESDLFQVDKNSEFELFSNNSTATLPSKQSTSLFNDTDSPLNNVEWTDFSAVSAENKTQTTATQSVTVTLSDPWSNLPTGDKSSSDLTTEIVPEAGGDNWAHFD